MFNVKTLMFDLDGTLVDSVPDLAWAVDRMCEDLDMPVRGPDRVRNWVGNGVRILIRRAIADSLEPAPDTEQVEIGVERFHHHYSGHCCVDTVLYPTVLDTLGILRDRGARLALITNKTSRFTDITLDYFGLTPYFEKVLSFDSLPLAKPDPLPLNRVMDELGRPGLYVGDSATDVAAARAAGIPVICMSYGYNHGQPIAQLNPDAVFDQLSDSLSTIQLV